MQGGGASTTGGDDHGGGSLRNNAFQWRNLYHHRYGVCTYAPPLPRNPSTTTAQHPNIHAYHALRDQQQQGSDGSSGRKSMAATIAEATGGGGAGRSGSLVSKSFDRSDSVVSADYTSPTASSAAHAYATGGPQQRNMLFSRSSFLMQRKAQLLLTKKREMEELRKQNPYGLESYVLSIHQAAWTLIMDDKVVLGSAMEARDFGESAREMKERLADQLRHTLMSIDSPFALDDPSGTQGEGSMAIGPRVGDHAFPSGSTHPLHATITDAHERRVHLLAEFSPFFAAVSPPNVVSHLHGIVCAKAGQYVAPRPGGAGDGVGLPIFSQYATWEEACTQRSAWARAPFHFFLTRDGSFHQSHIVAIVLMLETIGKYLHRHSPKEPRAGQGAVDSGRCDPFYGRKVSSNPTSQAVRVPLPPPQRNVPTAGSGADVTSSRSNTLHPGTAHFLGTTLPAPSGASLRRTSATPELWDGKQRYDSGTQCNTAGNPNPCPTLALEQVLEDALIVFEHAGARNALPMITTTMQLFLDKSMKPSLSHQLFGKAALLDVYVTENDDEEEKEATEQPPTFFGSGAPRHQQFAGVVPQLLHALHHPSASGGRQEPQSSGIDEGENDNEDDDEDEDAATVFSEREFHALFSLSQWFLDAPTAMGSGAIPIGGGGGTTAPGGGSGGNAGPGRQRRKRSPSASAMPQGYTRIQLAARAPTVSLAEAVVRYEEARRVRKQVAIVESRRAAAAAAVALEAAKLHEEEEARAQQLQALSDPSVDGVRRSRESSTVSHSEDPHRNYRRSSSIAHTQAFVGGHPVPGSASATPRPSVVSSDAPPLSSAPQPHSTSPFVVPIQVPGRQASPEPETSVDARPGPSPKEVVEREMPLCATKLATPLIVLSSYMKLHGVTWCNGVCRGLFEFLSHPDIVLYVTDDQLPPLPSAPLMGRGASVFSSPSETKSTKTEATPSIFSPRESLCTTQSEGTQSRAPSIGGGTVVGGPDDGQGHNFGSGTTTQLSKSPSAWKFPIDDESAVFASEQCSPTGSAGTAAASTQFFSTAGVEPSVVDFLSTMMQREHDIAQHIVKAMDIWFRALERSHSSQKLPSGIGYLVTTLCTMVHAHLLSGVVMTSALNVDGIEPDSLEFVDHLVDALIGGEQVGKPQQQAAATESGVESVGIGGGPTTSMMGPTSEQPAAPPPPPSVPRRRATVILDPSEDDPLTVGTSHPSSVPPRPPASGRSGSISDADASARSGIPQSSTGAKASSTSNSLVNDIRSFRLAKFVLFDMWLLPLLNNAQRFGLLPPSTSQHLLNNVNAFARYAKILVNASYVQRDEERKRAATEGNDAAAPSVAGRHSDPSIAGALARTTIPPYISGVYNASNGCLVQLFRHPETFVTGGDGKRTCSASSKKSAGFSGSAERRGSSGRRRSGGGRKNSAVQLPPTIRSPSVDGTGLSLPVRRPTRATGRGSVRPPPTSSTDDYYVLQEHAWPELAHISPPLQLLNNALGITLAADAQTTERRSSSVAAGLTASTADSARPAWTGMRGSGYPGGEGGGASLAAKRKTAVQMLETFCWNASTDDDRHRVVPEFQVPSHVAAACCDNLYRVISGQHPVTSVLARGAGPLPGGIGSAKGTPSVADLSDVTPSQQHRQSVVSTTSDPTGAAGPSGIDGGATPSAAGKNDAGVSRAAVDMYLRCLHSALLHPTIAGMALDCISVNHRKLFQQLIRLHKPVDGARDATSMACSLYPYLIVGVKDQPLVDINAITVLTTAMPSKDVPLPSAFIQARRRLLARQLFLATSANIDVNALAQAERSTGSPRRRRASHSVELPSEQRMDGGDSGDVAPVSQPLFAPWWCYMAAALCAKAECVIEECCGATARKWDKRCRQTMRRYSHRDSVMDVRTRPGDTTTGARKGAGHKQFTVTIEGPGGAPRTPTKQSKANGKHGSSPTRTAASASKPRATPLQSSAGPRPPRTVGLPVPLSEAPLAQRRGSGNTAPNTRRFGNALLQRWRDAVTDMVRRDDSTEVSSTYTS